MTKLRLPRLRASTGIDVIDNLRWYDYVLVGFQVGFFVQGWTLVGLYPTDWFLWFCAFFITVFVGLGWRQARVRVRIRHELRERDERHQNPTAGVGGVVDRAVIQQWATKAKR